MAAVALDVESKFISSTLFVREKTNALARTSLVEVNSKSVFFYPKYDILSINVEYICLANYCEAVLLHRQLLPLVSLERS